jgi:carbonic anhydrase
MISRSTCKAFVFFLTCALMPALLHAQTSTHPHWSYEGKEDPKHWGELDPTYAACSSGHTQSPINIVNAKQADLPPLQFSYNAVPLSIVDNGHTIMVNYAPGSTLTVGDKVYTLQQFHFHHPSEEHINGKKYDLVAHLVHADADGHVAVVAILFKRDSTPTPLFDTLWKYLSTEKEKVVEISSVTINAKDLLPPTTGYYTFAGSLTTPPCTEGVTWYVLKTPVDISGPELEVFARIYKDDNRPIQPTNHRAVLESK